MKLYFQKIWRIIEAITKRLKVCIQNKCYLEVFYYNCISKILWKKNVFLNLTYKFCALLSDGCFDQFVVVDIPGDMNPSGPVGRNPSNAQSNIIVNTLSNSASANDFPHRSAANYTTTDVKKHQSSFSLHYALLHYMANTRSLSNSCSDHFLSNSWSNCFHTFTSIIW